MITIHEAKATDFGTLGLGALLPSECVVRERAGGMYELRIVHPVVDDGRHKHIKPMRIIKAPAPVRETPLLNLAQTGAVERAVYRVRTNDLGLNMRTAPNGKIIGTYRPNTEVVKLGQDDDGNWFHVALMDGGASGWMYSEYLEFVRTEMEIISGDTPGIVQPRQTREQLFRIYYCSPDTKTRTVTAEAQHITYDLAGAVVDGEYSPEGVPADQVCAQIMSRADHDVSEFHIYCTVSTPISGEYGGRNILDCLLDPENGVVAQTKARLIRDNYDIFILPDEARNRGVELRYGKNLISASMDTDSSDIITRIKPVGKDANGEKLYIDKNGGWVESPYINEYPVIRSKTVEYDVAVSDDLSIEKARTLLEEKAEADFIAGCDMFRVRLDADFVRLEVTEDYKHLANAYALHLYDSVPVIDREANIMATARMTEYIYDSILDEYEDTGLGELDEVKSTVYGYELAAGSVSGGKLIPNTVNGDRLQNSTVSYGKFDIAAIKQLAADAIIAVRAEIRKLVAGEITTDQLYADLAVIAAAQITAANIEKANIQWAEIENLIAEIAKIANAEIGSATIDYAKIVDAVLGTAIITEGVGGKLYIERLSVTEANMVQLTVGELMLKDANGNFVRLTVDEDGNVNTEIVTVENDNIANSTISGGKLIENTITARELNVAQIFADEALIRVIKAANIDVADLFASEATINALNSSLIYTDTIKSLSSRTVGGENLIRNGGFYNGLDGWAQYSYGINGTGHQMYVATENRDVPSLWLHAENETGIFGAIQTVKGLRKNAQYIIHGYAAVRNTGGFSVEIRDAASGTFLLSRRFSVTAAGEDNLSLYEKFEAVFETGESTDVNILLYSNTFGANAYIFLAQIKLEEGNTATAWSPARTDPANSLTAGSSVTINEEEVRIATKRFEVEAYREDGSTASMRFTADALAVDRIDSPSVAPRYMGPAHVYVDPAATGAQIEAGTHFRTLSDALQTVNNKQLGYEVTIHMAGGMTEYGQLMIAGICGEALFITSDSGNHATLHGVMRIRRCSAEVEITHVDVTVPGDTLLSAFVVRSCSYVRIAECVVSSYYAAFHISRGANVMAEGNTVFAAANEAGYVMYGGRAHFQNNIGGGRLICDAGVMTIAGTVPEMGVTYLNTFEPNNIDAVTPTGAGGAPVAPVITTAEYPMMYADSYAAGNVDSWAYPESKPSDDLYQGYTGQAGRICGCIWFDNAAIRAALNTKTVNQASIRLTAHKYVGRGAAVTVHLRGTATEYEGRSGHPALTTDYGAIGTAEPGTTVTLTIPNQAVTDLVNGTVNGLMLYSEDVRDMEGRNYSQNYMRFDGGTSGTAETRPALTVVYQ